MRVRALKSTTWMLADDTLAGLCVALASVRPAEYLAEWLFQEQKAGRLAIGVIGDPVISKSSVVSQSHLICDQDILCAPLSAC